MPICRAIAVSGAARCCGGACTIAAKTLKKAAERLDGSCYDLLNAFSSRQVGSDRQHTPPTTRVRKAGQRGGSLFQRRLTACANRDAAAFLDQRASTGETEPLARTGDDRDLVGEL